LTPDTNNKWQKGVVALLCCSYKLETLLKWSIAHCKKPQVELALLMIFSLRKNVFVINTVIPTLSRCNFVYYNLVGRIHVYLTQLANCSH